MKKKEETPQTAASQEAASPETPKKPKFTVLGTIGYDTPEDFDKFVADLNKANALYVLMAGVNYAQSKGIYSLMEAGLLAASIKKFLKTPEDKVVEQQAN